MLWNIFWKMNQICFAPLHSAAGFPWQPACAAVVMATSWDHSQSEQAVVSFYRATKRLQVQAAQGQRSELSMWTAPSMAAAASCCGLNWIWACSWSSASVWRISPRSSGRSMHFLPVTMVTAAAEQVRFQFLDEVNQSQPRKKIKMRSRLFITRSDASVFISTSLILMKMKLMKLSLSCWAPLTPHVHEPARV